MKDCLLLLSFLNVKCILMILSKVFHSVLKSAEQYIQIMSFDIIIWFFIQIKKDWLIFENYAYIQMKKIKWNTVLFSSVHVLNDVVWYQLNGRIRDLKNCHCYFKICVLGKCGWVTSCCKPGIHIFFGFFCTNWEYWATPYGRNWCWLYQFFYKHVVMRVSILTYLLFSFQDF